MLNDEQRYTLLLYSQVRTQQARDVHPMLVPMLGQRRRRWANIEPTLGKPRLVLAEKKILLKTLNAMRHVFRLLAQCGRDIGPA